MDEKTIRFIDLFGGIGGFRYGLENANKGVKSSLQGRWNKNTRDAQDIRCGGDKSCFEAVWYCDIDKYAVQTYNKNFNEHYEPTDIRTVNPETIPDFDMLCGGFPCQSFSIAGKRKGFQDIRGTLFFEIYRIAKAKRPRLLFLENVKGLLSADDGRCFGTILSSLDELGYDVEWQVLNSKNFGVPQNRERVFIIGHLRGTGGQTIFPLREDGGFSKEEYEQPVQREIQTGETNSKHVDTEDVEDGQDGQLHRGEINVIHNSRNEIARVYGCDGLSPTLRSNRTGGWREPKVALRWVRTEKGKQVRKESQKNGKDYTPFNEGHRELAISKKNISGCVTNAINKDSLVFDSLHGFGHGWQGYHNKKAIAKGMIRRLTPIECERLQGFPDNWTSGISDTQRYKCLGNAVTVNVIEAIGKELSCCFHGVVHE